MITRGTVLLAAALLATPLLAACGDDGGADSAAAASASANPLTGSVDVDGNAVPLSFQVRPVLTVRESRDDECADEPPVRYAVDRPLERSCSLDATLVYSLGPAVITEDDVSKVAAVENVNAPDEQIAEVELDDDGAKAFEELTGRVNEKDSPRNMFAILVDGRVASSPQVTAGAITGGTLQVSFSDPAWTDTFVQRWPADQR